MKTRIFHGICATVLLAGLMGLGGCADKVTKDDVWSDMSPGMHTLSRNEDQRKTDILRSFDTNFRTIPDDWDYIWLQHRPLYMTDYPVP